MHSIYLIHIKRSLQFETGFSQMAVCVTRLAPTSTWLPPEYKTLGTVWNFLRNGPRRRHLRQMTQMMTTTVLPRTKANITGIQRLTKRSYTLDSSNSLIFPP